MKFLKNLFLYFSAFIPLFVLLVVKLLVDIFNNNLTFNFLNIFNLSLLFLMIALGIVGILWNTKFSKEKTSWRTEEKLRQISSGLYNFWIDMWRVTLFMKNRNAALRFCYQRFESVTPELNNLGTCIHVQF